MLILSPGEARVGMTLVAPVVNPTKPDQELLKRGYILDEKIIARLTEIGVEFVYVDYPGLDELDKHLTPFLSPERRQICTQIKDVFKLGQKSTRPDAPYSEYYGAMRDMILALMSQGQNPLFLDQMSRMGTDAVGHAAAVAHLSLLLGMRLERYLIEQRKRLAPAHARETVNIGIAGMMHDIGKTQLPPHLQQFNALNPPENEAERREWENHPRLGYEMVHNGIEPSGASAILHHHQHFDGSGFPVLHHRDGTVSRLSEFSIHVFPRIVQVADLYDRIATSGNKRLPNAMVLHIIRNKYASWCDPTVLQSLHLVAPPFPPGNRVTLDDGTSAIVVKIDTADPYRPIIRRVRREDWQMEGEPISLRHPGAPKICEAGGIDVGTLFPQRATEEVKQEV